MNFLRTAFLALAAITCSVQATAGPLTVRLTALRKANAASSVVFLGGGGASTTTVYDGTNIASSAVSGTAPGATFGNDTDIATAYPGLIADISQAGSAVITSGQMQFRYGGNGDDSFTQTLSTADFKMTVKIGSGFNEHLIWDRFSRSSYSSFAPIAGDGAHFLLGGGLSNYVSWGRAIVAGDVVGIERAGNQIFFTLNGAAIGDPITQASQTHNNVVGIQKNGGGYFDDFSITSTPSSPLGLAGLAYDSEGYPTLTGTYQGSAPTSIDYRYQKLDGTASSAWQTASGTIGSGTFTVAGAGSLRTLTTLGARIQVRANDGSTPRTDLAIKTTTVPAVQAIPAFIKGMNSGQSAGFPEYSTLVGVRDRMKQASLRSYAPTGAGSSGTDPNSNAYVVQPLQVAYGSDIPATAAGMGFDGVPHQYPPSANYFRYYLPTWWEVGTYQFGNLPSGMTIDVNPGSSGAVNYNSTNKTLTFTQNLNPSIAVTFSGTIPAAGINPTLYKSGDTHTDRLYADTRITALTTVVGANGVQRVMEEDQVNRNQITRSGCSQLWSGSIAGGPRGPPIQIAEVNAAGLSIWKNINLAASDAEITCLATAFAQGVDRTTYWELSNEVWNNGFRQWFDAILNGLRAGYYNANGDAGAQNVIDGSGKFTTSGGTRVPNQGFASGAKVALNDGGFYLWQANRAITASSSADAPGNTTNAAWTVLATPNDSQIAGMRWYSSQLKHVFSLIDAAYNAAGVPLTKRVRVVAWQVGGLGAMEDILAWGGLVFNYDLAATAPYWSGGEGRQLCDYNQDLPGWTTAQKDLILTNVPAFKTALFAAANDTIDEDIRQTVGYKQGLAKWLYDTYGILPDARRYGAYEANWHCIVSNWPGTFEGIDGNGNKYHIGKRAALAANWADILRDPRMGAATTRYMAGWRDRVGDLINMFDMGGYAPGANDNTNFDMQEFEDDFSTARIAAVKAF